MNDTLKLALEALEESKTNNDSTEFHDRKNKAITVIKKALAQPEQELVAWQFMNGSSFRKRRPDDFSDLAPDGLPYWRPLYTTPPAAQPAQQEPI